MLLGFYVTSAVVIRRGFTVTISNPKLNENSGQQKKKALYLSFIGTKTKTNNVCRHFYDIWVIVYLEIPSAEVMFYIQEG